MTIRETFLKILQEHAEEPDDIKDGIGTFVTFRTEYVLNDLESLFNKLLSDKVLEIEKKRAKTTDDAYTIFENSGLPTHVWDETWEGWWNDVYNQGLDQAKEILQPTNQEETT